MSKHPFEVVKSLLALLEGLISQDEKLPVEVRELLGVVIRDGVPFLLSLVFSGESNKELNHTHRVQLVLAADRLMRKAGESQ